MAGILSNYTTFKIGGSCRSLAFPNSLEELILDIKNSRDYIILGNGSNVLISDGYIDRDFIIVNKINYISFDGTEVSATCGTDISILCEKSCEKGLSGLEFMYKIPGSVGGCLYMNSGAFEHTISEIVKSITVFDKRQDKIIELTPNDCCYGYKSSAFMNNEYVILSATFNLVKKNISYITEKMNDIRLRRENTQPKEASAGSFFKRPAVNIFASKMIDECGLKGYRVGDAIVSEKHAGFICNIGSATYDDIIKVSEHVQETVLNKKGIQIVPEVIIIK